MDSSEEAKKLWVPDAKDVWRLATVVTSTDSDAMVLSADGLSESTVKVDDTAIYDISHSLPLDDLSRYNNLHEAPLLMGLKSRFSSNVSPWEADHFTPQLLLTKHPKRL